MVYPFYTICISVDFAHHEIFCAKVGKCGTVEKKIKHKRRGKFSKGVLFHQDNVPFRKKIIAMDANNANGFVALLFMYHYLLFSVVLCVCV